MRSGSSVYSGQSGKAFAVVGLILIGCLAIVWFGMNFYSKLSVKEEIEKIVESSKEIQDIQYEKISCSFFTGKTHIEKPVILFSNTLSVPIDSLDIKKGFGKLHIKILGIDISNLIMYAKANTHVRKILDMYPDSIKSNIVIDTNYDKKEQKLFVKEASFFLENMFKINLSGDFKNVIIENGKFDSSDMDKAILKYYDITFSDKGISQILKSYLMEESHVLDKDIPAIVDQYCSWLSKENRDELVKFINNPKQIRFRFENVQEKNVGFLRVVFLRAALDKNFDISTYLTVQVEALDEVETDSM